MPVDAIAAMGVSGPEWNIGIPEAPAGVDGAEPGDTTSAQFWIDQERLLFVRLLGQSTENTGPYRWQIGLPARIVTDAATWNAFVESAAYVVT